MSLDGEGDTATLPTVSASSITQGSNMDEPSFNFKPVVTMPLPNSWRSISNSTQKRKKYPANKLTGFVDLGSVNADIEHVLGDDSTKTEKKLAEHAFVFLARAVFKPSIAIPVAHCFSASLSGIQTSCMHACLCVYAHVLCVCHCVCRLLCACMM